MATSTGSEIDKDCCEDEEGMDSGYSRAALKPKYVPSLANADHKSAHYVMRFSLRQSACIWAIKLVVVCHLDKTCLDHLPKMKSTRA